MPDFWGYWWCLKPIAWGMWPPLLLAVILCMPRPFRRGAAGAAVVLALYLTGSFLWLRHLWPGVLNETAGGGARFTNQFLRWGGIIGAGWGLFRLVWVHRRHFLPVRRRRGFNVVPCEPAAQEPPPTEPATTRQ